MRWIGMTIVCGLSLSALFAQPPAPVPFLQPAAIALAATDVATLGPVYQEYALYVWVPPSVADKDLDLLWRVLSGHVNGMSREPDLIPLAVVPGSGGRLLRASLLDYRWKASTVQKWGEVDPYFYTSVEVPYAATKDYKAGVQNVVAMAPWATDAPGAREASLALIASTKKRTPIVSATLLAFTTFVSTNGSPKYDEFLEIKTEKDYFKAVGVREDEDEAFEAALLAVIAKSGVTKEPRGVEIREKIAGQLFRTHDFNKAVNGSNPFRNLGRQGKTLRVKADAHENFANAANGMWIVGLFNGQGVSQDVAPQAITTGDTTTTDFRNHDVEKPLSCFRCHVDAGLKDLDDWVRNLESPPPMPPLSLQIGNKNDPQNLAPAVEESLRFRRLYTPKLEPAIRRGRQRFTEALAIVTGMKPQDYAAGYGRVYNLLVEPVIDSAWVARDYGLTERAFVAAIDRQVKTAGGVDPEISGFLKPRELPKGQAGTVQQPLQLRQYLSLYPSIQKTVRGIVDVKKVKP